MPDLFSISAATSDDEVRQARQLFEEYAATLPVDLAYQAFADELASLPGKYATPGGVLLIVRNADGNPAGCVGVRPLDAAVCEMKRLYIRPWARGAGLGRALAAEAIRHATRLGYTEMRLDTLASMDAALSLYQALGFRPCPAYYAPTPPGTAFLAKTL